MARYRSVLKSKRDDRLFAARVRFRIPQGGLSVYPDLDAFLRERVGGDYALHSAGRWPQTSYLYAHDPELLVECVKRFDLALDMPDVPGPPIRFW